MDKKTYENLSIQKKLVVDHCREVIGRAGHHTRLFSDPKSAKETVQIDRK